MTDRPILKLRFIPTDDEREIWVAPAQSGGGYTVTIRPPIDGDPPVDYPTLKEARGYAGGLRVVKGWKVVDCADGATAI